MASVAVSVAMVMVGVRLVDLISLGRDRAKPYIGMTRLAQILQDSSASSGDQELLRTRSMT